MARRILITGGARGIGLGIARRLAGQGGQIVIGDLSEDNARAAAASLPGTGHLGLALDVRSEASLTAAFARAEAGGPVDGLVCNAGILILLGQYDRTPLIDTELDEWQGTMDVNLTGTFLTIRTFLRARRDRPTPSGRIVTMSSVAAQLGGYRSSVSYITSKAGVLGLTKAVAREAAKDGITCNAIAPGLIDTAMLASSMPAKDAPAAMANIPAGRIGTTDDIAAAVEYLMSDGASYVTGTVIDVNGGYRMR